MRAFCLAIMVAALGLRMATYATADGANPSYLGTWKLTGAIAAPWAGGANAADHGRFVGQTLRLDAAAINGPAPLACQRARYRFRDLAVGAIFDGAFEEMRAADPLADPDAMAAALGFIGPSVKSLQSGCTARLYFINDVTAQVVLRDTIYTLKRQ